MDYSLLVAFDHTRSTIIVGMIGRYLTVRACAACVHACVRECVSAWVCLCVCACERLGKQHKLTYPLNSTELDL